MGWGDSWGSGACQNGKDVAAAIRCFDDFSVTYQAAADEPRPLYRRAARGQAPEPR